MNTPETNILSALSPTPIAPAPARVAAAEVQTAAEAAAPAPVAAPAELPPAVALAVIESNRPRSRRHALDWPVRYVPTGKLYTVIVTGRPSTAQIADYFARVSAEPNAEHYLPAFVDENGQTVPDAVLDALDDDDSQVVMADLADFLPARFRLASKVEPEKASTPADGAPTAPTSAT